MKRISKLMVTVLLLGLPICAAWQPGTARSQTPRRTGLQARPAADLTRADELEQAVDLARRTLEFVERDRRCPALAARLSELERRAAQLPSAAGAQRASLRTAVRQLRREIIFAHPRLDFDRLLVNKRPPPAYSHQSRQYLGRYSRPGPGLVVLDRWKDRPRETLLLRGKLPPGTVMHPELSFDARRVVFSFCDHSPADPNLRQFFLWEIGIDGQGLRQLTGKPADRLAGVEGRQTSLIEDFDPCYLPDGGIVFVSTRTQTHIRCQYGGRYFANFLLYRADANGDNIRPLSFAEAPEWEPSVLGDGRIIYSRWDYTNRHSYHFQSLWVSRPDGTATASYYGNLTRNPCNTAEMLASRAYASLVSRDGLVSIAQGDMESDFSVPKDYFAHAGRLAKMLLAGHPDEHGQVRVHLDHNSFQRIIDWLDVNAVCYGDFSWNKPEWRKASPEGERALREHIGRSFGQQLAEQPFAALVNVALPEESRILKAPLVAEAGGWEIFPENVWPDTNDSRYVEMRRLVQAAIAPLSFHDIAGTCGHPDRCVCDCCWVRLWNEQAATIGFGSRSRSTTQRHGESVE